MKIRNIVLAGVAAIAFVFSVATPSWAANVNDFVISNFEADYYLSRDDTRASRLHVKEQITATFPQIDQNHGIERALPEEYDGHTLRLAVKGVVGEAGQPIPYTTRSENANTVLRIGDPDAYVHGTQTYVIEYSYQNVTRNFDNHDEIFWDTNGTQWQQPFHRVEARVHLSKELATNSGRHVCFIGREGSKEPCEIGQEVSHADGTKTITFLSGRALRPSENLSFAIDFPKNTFAPFTMTAEERAWQTLMGVLITLWVVVMVVVPIVMTIVLIKVWRRYGRPPRGRGTIAPEYLPPKGMSVLLVAEVAKSARHTITAQILDLAVRHYIKIYEIEKNKLFKKKSFEIEIIKSPESLRPEERELITIVFGKDQAVGQKVRLDDIAQKRYKQVAALNKQLKQQAEANGFFVRHKKPQTKYYVIGIGLIIVGFLSFTFTVLLSGIATMIVAKGLRPRTEKGVALMEYLEGMKMYMALAEAERLKVLQSPDGARRVDISDKKQLIKLYEKILPYAILLGVEKEWGKQFTKLSDKAPDWYIGSSQTFNSAIFVGSLSSLTSVTSSTFSSPSSSSSSGFSGGSSGGGGGGGGGGGW